MKRILPLLFLLPAALFAAEVSPKDAARAAQAWVDRGYAMGRLPAGRNVARVEEIEDAETGARLLLASFEGGGWVLLSADDLVDPVIAFAEEGDGFDVDDENPFWTLVRGGEPAPTAVGKGAGDEPTAAQRKWANLLDDTPVPTSLSTISDVRVEPFVTTHWGQSSGWANYYTPYIGVGYNGRTYNGNSVAGCVAIALAQIMRYWKYPASAEPKTFTCKTNGLSCPKTMMGGTYDWANMPDRYSGTETQKQAVGKLAYDCGVAVQMNWKGSSAGATMSYIAYRAKDTFGYANATYSSISDDTLAAPASYEKMKSIVIPNCDLRAPASISVARYVGTERYGHAVILNGYGYSGGDLVLRINFGWSGTGDDAWYIPPTLDSSNTYTHFEGFSHNIFPTKTGYIASGRVLDMNGEAVADATVALSDGQTATTDAKGIYAFVAAKGDYTATASKGGVSESRSLAALGTTSTSSVGNLYDQDIRFTQPLVPSPTVTLGDASNVSFTSATVNYAVSALGDGATRLVSVTLAYSTSSDFSGALTATKTNQGAGAGTFALTGLSDNTKYYVRVKAENDLGGWSTATGSFTTSAYTAPTVSAPSANVSAGLPLPLTATLSSLGAGSTWVDLVAQASTSPSFAVIEASDTVHATSTGSKSFSLAGLGAGATYYVRVVATGSNGKAATSSTITAKPVDLAAPAGSFALGTPTRVSIPVTWSMTSLGTGNSSATVHLDYGTSDALGSTLTVGTFNATKSNQSATLAGLDPNTEYHVRLRLVGGGRTFATDPATATTLPVGDPAVAVSVVQRLQRGATLRITVTDIGDAARSATVYVDYGTTTSYGMTKTAGTISEAGSLDCQITELESETDYCVRVRVVNNGGKTGTATTTFKTLEPNDPAFALDVSTSYRSAYFDATVTRIGEGAASAAGYVRWGSSSALSPELGRAPFGKVSTVPATVRASAAGLTAGTTYYYEAVITNNITGRKTATGSFTTQTAGDLTIGTGYYEPGLIMGYTAEAWPNDDPAALGQRTWSASTATRALGAISAYARKPNKCVNALDNKEYSMSSGGVFVFEGEMFMEAGRTYRFASEFFQKLFLSVDGTNVIAQAENNGGSQSFGSVSSGATGWHAIKIVTAGNDNGFGYCGGGTTWANTSSPFNSAGMGLAFNTNGDTSVSNGNIGNWKRVMDSGDRHLLRAKGKQPPMAFLSETPTFGSTTMRVPVSLDTAYDNLTLTVYASRSPDCWYFEDRWEKTVVVGSTGAAGAKTLNADFTGIDTSVDWYVSARLSDGANYDQWTDPVKFTPVVVRDPPAGNVSVGMPDFTSNDVTTTVTSFGDDSTSVAIVLEWGTDSTFAEKGTVALGTVGTTGAKSTTLSPLAPGTTYYVRAVLTGSPSGLSSTTAAASFTTPAYTAPSIASVAASGTGATKGRVTVGVSSLGQGSSSATISVYLSPDGVFGSTPAATRSISATGSQTFDLAGLSASTVYCVKVVVAGSNGKSATDSSATFATDDRTREEKEWFNVDLTKSGYSSIPHPVNVGDSGTWSGAGAFALVHSAANGTLALALADGAAETSELRYAADGKSAAGCDAEVRGSVVATPHRSLAALPAAPSGALAGLAFVRGSGGLTPCGLCASGWTALSPSVAAGSTVPWRAIFDFSSANQPRVRYAIGSTTNGWLALASGTRLSGVGFRGDQTVGSFRGTYWKVVEELAVKRPAAAVGGTSGGSPAIDPDTGDFRVRVGEMVEGWNYTVFASATIDGSYTAVADSVRATASVLANGLEVPCPPKGDGTTLFVKIVASDGEFSKGDAFPADAQ